ncbi:hypothetical protein F3N42_14040 [Marinihelvus fidelis]|uniref:Peptidase S74 domain-containing protein n=1 Tax=Marinihelvus fidelis TaxID=2613842 RepID=A0A5N0T4J0_9GAMM|nr:tail fiber domain-containing protein [Marinihelvus fidelis]KAA9129772.1 hypothetical protein F3N42_14040 [Marinihelvus fidelis]
MNTTSRFCCVLLTAAFLLPAFNAWAVNLIGNDLYLDDATPAVTFNDTDAANSYEYVILGEAAFFKISEGATSIFNHDTNGQSTAVGYNASSAGDYSTALGNGASSGGISSIALGYGASSGGNLSTALGDSASSDGSHSTALGFSASSGGLGSGALGVYATSGGGQSTALGNSASSAGTNSTALGYGASSAGAYSTAIGYKASAPNPDTIILGEIPSVNYGLNYTAVANGTTDPLAPLHIFRDDGTASVLVVENSADQGPRTLFEIENNGNPEFRMTNTAMGNSWVFSAGLRFVVKNNQGDWVMRVTDTGKLEIGGTLLEMSDREQKHAIVPLDSDVVLEKLVQVPITEWAYRDESADQRHIGPMAQDFHAAFGLASGEKAISARDMAGVNMAAIQALADRNRWLELRYERQVSRNDELEARIAELESDADRVDALQARIAVMERLVPNANLVLTQGEAP